MRTPQRDVPTEKIIHYIVKDYQRMYNGFHAMREEKQAYIDELLKKLSKKTNAISRLQSENKILMDRIKEVQASRDAVVREITEDLEEQLEEANRRIALLAQAVTDPDKADSVFLKRCQVRTIETDDDRKWMKKAMAQLEKAMLNFTTIQARLDETYEAMGKALSQQIIGGDADRTYNRFAKVFPKIDSCVSHIEDFFIKVGDIKIEDNG